MWHVLPVLAALGVFWYVEVGLSKDIMRINDEIKEIKKKLND